MPLPLLAPDLSFFIHNSENSLIRATIYLAAWGLPCSSGASFSSREQGLRSSCSAWLLTAAASLVAKHRLQGVCASMAVVHGFGCPVARGILAPGQRDPSCVLCIGRQIPSHWTTREVPQDLSEATTPACWLSEILLHP